MNQGKPRPFTLATACDPVTRGTLVYGSTQDTERRAGAACIQIDPRRLGLNRNGLQERTRFYPGILFRTRHAELPGAAGRLGRSLDDLRAALRVALGIGRGSCLSASAPPRSRRGRIVELESRLAADLRTSLAVLLTEPEYSRARNYHVILPLYAGVPNRVDSGVLSISGREWLDAFPRGTESVWIPVQVTQSVWYDDDIERETEHVVDEDTLAEIDRGLCAYFSLPMDD